MLVPAVRSPWRRENVAIGRNRYSSRNGLTGAVTAARPPPNEAGEGEPYLNICSSFVTGS
jgi:hypothetical protein